MDLNSGSPMTLQPGGSDSAECQGIATRYLLATLMVCLISYYLSA